MSHDVISVQKATALQELAELLVSSGISGVPVVNEKQRLVGMATLRDLVRASVEHRSEEALRVEDVMTPAVVSVRETASVAFVAALMTRERIHRVPICTGAGKLVGVATTADVARWLAVHEGHLLES